MIDWVSRTLYWSQLNNAKSSKSPPGSSVYKMDLNDHSMEDQQPQLVLTSTSIIRLVQIDPFTRY